jgi:transcriptional regulator with XRE-family HTH domain
MRKGMTLEKVAELTGYTTSAFGKIERRLNGISPGKVERVLEALQMEFDDVFEIVGDIQA